MAPRVRERRPTSNRARKGATPRHHFRRRRVQYARSRPPAEENLRRPVPAWYEHSKLTITETPASLLIEARTGSGLDAIRMFIVAGVLLALAGGGLAYLLVEAFNWHFTPLWLLPPFVVLLGWLGMGLLRGAFLQAFGKEEIRVRRRRITWKRDSLLESWVLEADRVREIRSSPMWVAGGAFGNGARNGGSVLVETDRGSYPLGLGLDGADAARVSSAMKQRLGLVDERIRIVPAGCCAACDHRSGLNHHCLTCALGYCDGCVPTVGACLGCNGTVAVDPPPPS